MKSTITLFVLFFSVLGFTQNNSNDLPKENDTILVQTYLKKSKQFETNLDSAAFYIQKAKDICVNRNLTNKIPEVNNEFAWLYFLKGEYPKAIEYAQYVLTYPDIDGFEEAKAYNTMASAYQFLGNYTEALSYFYKGLKIHETNDFKRGIAVTYNNIAAIYHEQESNIEALELFKKVNQIYVSLNDTVNISTSTNNIASMYLKEKKYDSAKQHYQIAYKINSEKKYIIEQARVSINLGQLYLEIEEYEKSLKYIEEAIEIFQKTNNKKDLAICYYYKSLLLAKQDKDKLAMSMMHIALKYAKKANYHKFEIDIVNELSKLYEKNEDYKNAFKYNKEYTLLKDSIFSIEKIQALENITSVYEIEKKEQEIILLQKKQEIKTVKNNILTFTIITILILFTIIVYVFILRYKGSKQKIIILNEEKRANKLEIEKQELANKHLISELSYKEKELTTNAMHIIQVKENNIKIVEELTNLRKSLKIDDSKQQKLISDLIRYISINKNDDIWKEFELRFTQVHEDFYKKLNNQYPNLTPNEKKLCAFLRLNMTTKEISMITHRAPNSIRVARTRLRKKLAISSDDNLINFLASF